MKKFKTSVVCVLALTYVREFPCYLPYVLKVPTRTLIIQGRTMRPLWETRVSPNVIYSLQHLQNDTSTLVVGGIDGILRVLDQNTGEVLSCCIMEGEVLCTSQSARGAIETRKGRRLLEDIRIDSIPRSSRPPITCLAVGMKKVVTTHNSKYIKLWKFS